MRRAVMVEQRFRGFAGGRLSLFFLGVLACSGTVNVGEPAAGFTFAKAPPTSNDAGPPPTSDASLLAPDPAKYAWKWLNPVGTGAALRATFSVPSGETFFVGDNGTVLREIGGVTTVLREGAPEESLVAVWGLSADDLWVGGARGEGGVLIHWDGKKWSENFRIASLPIQSLAGLSDGTLIVIAAGQAFSMDREGRAALMSCTGGRPRDVWVRADDEIWFVGDGGVSLRKGNDCALVDDHKGLGIWGSGADLFVVSEVSTTTLELRRFTGQGFLKLGAIDLESRREFGGGKILSGDSSGRLFMPVHDGSLAHTGRKADGYAVYDPVTQVLGVIWTYFPHGGNPFPYAETILAVGARRGEVTFAGARGLRGRFSGVLPSDVPMRARLTRGMPAPDGAVFARCVNHDDNWGTSTCRWESGAGWTRLPTIPTFVGTSGVATSSTEILLGGYMNSPTDYETRIWDGVRWASGREQTSFRFLYASGPGDIWASSDYDTVHFDGTAWSTVARGRPETGGLVTADGRGPRDVWLLDRLEGLSRWDGASLSKVTPLPDRHSAIDRGLVRVDDGAWIVGLANDEGTPWPRRLFHYDGSSWNRVDLPGYDVLALSRGPDGKVRMLVDSGFQNVSNTSVYVVDDTGITREFDAPPGVILNDLFQAGDSLFAIGEGGVTLRLERIDSTPLAR